MSGAEGAAQRRSVLVVAYHFPPLGGGGVQRTLKHVRYLPESGWDPVVVTTSSSVHHTFDATLAAELAPGVPVLRAGELVFGHRLRRTLMRCGLPAPAYVEGWPDRHAGWIPGAVRASLRAVREHRPDALLTTSPAVSAHAVGLIVSRITGLPWVADFRDEFVHNPWPSARPAALRAADRALESAVCGRARRVVVTTDAALLTRARQGDPHRVTIPNGVDAEDVPPAPARPRHDSFRLSFVGSLYRDVDCAPIFAALARLAGRGELDPSRCEVRLVGNVGVPRTDAGAVPVVRTGYVDHARACREMTEASVLLCYVPPPAHPTPGKIFEYLATGRPILCATGADNHAWHLVEELGAGLCADPRDGAALEAAIAELYTDWAEGRRGPSAAVREAVLARFSRRRLAAHLAVTLDAAVGAPPARLPAASAEPIAAVAA